jgi:kynurenine formamidase
MTVPSIPTYADLLRRTDAPPGSSWRVFGPDDQLGTLNFLTAESARSGAALVRHGQVFNLDYPLNTFVPSLAGTRPATEHHIFANNPHHRDDWIDSFYLQSTSQVDGLRHIGHPKHGFYGGVAVEEIAEASPALGIQLLAEKGIAGRGILLDAVRYFDHIGEPLLPDVLKRITPTELDAMAEHFGVEVRHGDILLLRTGWSGWWLSLPAAERRLSPGSPGLDQSSEMVAWLWDHGIAIAAADNAGLEAHPMNPDSGWFDPDEPPPPAGPSHNGILHRPLIALLGLIIGELWKLDDLADACAADGGYEFMVTVSPLNLCGGVGSPPNALAIR